MLTLGRLVCVPFFILFFVLHWYKAVLIVYLIGAISDLIDGTVARLLKENSELGATLDPIADKVCMLTVFLSLALARVVPWWFVIIMLVRDGVVLMGFLYVKIHQMPYRIHAILSSKIATLLETIAGTFAIIFLAYPYATIANYPMGDLTFGSILVASIGILVATLQYLKRGMQMLEQKFTG